MCAFNYQLHHCYPELKYPKYYEGDIRVRFYYDVNGKSIDVLNLDEVADSTIIIEAIEKGNSEFLKEVDLV